MFKSLTALAVFALLAASVVALPGFAPVEASETVALAKADRLDIKPARDCSQQVWPNFEAACLHGANSASGFREARLVTAGR